ncbi:carbohydrate-binding domain-containing protein [Dysgonomonas sp. 521]|uniref:carbohydrate-binding domain-containing protein n=1 Tax=Dysgonomonas sp. 521 TaxID=2302932 RepID=UPI0013D3B019|nr:carbohydrate-binding domain-containing protein [Dysgonomonas sp. 521]NDV94505.1 carbohydrate-binding domain-containing protein [Dysgonomonas sp. 521]
MFAKKIFILLSLGISLSLLYSCSDDNIPETEEIETPEEPTIPEDPGDNDDDPLNPNSQDINYENAVTIAFSSSGVTIDNPFNSNGVEIENNESHMIIRSSVTNTEINYILSGITNNGSVKIYGETPFGLILNGTGITNPNGAAINIQSKQKASLTIIDNTNNRLFDNEEYTFIDGEDMKATFFSEGDIEIGGNGSLEIRGKNRHSLCSDGALTIRNGNINIKESASDGIHTNDGVTISGGLLTIRSAGDGIDTGEPINITGGEINITTTGQKGHALKTDEDISINTSDAITVTVYGNASKGFNSKGNFTLLRGDITINTGGDAIWEEDEQDTSSAAGIKCDKNLLIENGNLTILSTGSGGKGINVEGTLTINDGTVYVTTTGNQFVYDRNNDTAAKAIKSDGNLTINGGTITIRTSQTEAEGLESKATLTITGGNIDIEAYDDCINASDHIQIDGGNIYCNSVTNDGIDSNGTLTITGGVVIAAGSSSNSYEGGIDCDWNQFSITGGTIIGTGGGGMQSTPTASVSRQRSLIFNTRTQNVEIIRIQSTSDGSEVLTFRLPKTYNRLNILFSSPLLESNTGYTIYTGGTISGGTDFYGLYTGATYSGGTSAGSFTTGSAQGSVSTVGSSGGF